MSYPKDGYKSVSDKAKERWADPEFRKKMSDKLKAFWANPANRQRMESADKDGWKGRDDRRQIVSKRVSEFRRGRPLSESHRAAIKAAMAERTDEVRFHSPRTRKKISRANKGRVLTKKQKLKHRLSVLSSNLLKAPEREARRLARQEEAKKLWHVCSCKPDCQAVVKDPSKSYARGHHPSSKNPNRFNHCWLYKGLNGEILMRTTWEVIYAHLLDSQKVTWQYETKTFEMDGGCGTRTTYTPDFYLPETDEYVEVKGYLRATNEFKLQSFAEQYPGVHLRLVRKDTINAAKRLFGMPEKKY